MSYTFSKDYRKAGLCLVCGKSTKTGDHRPCSEYAIEAKAIAERRRRAEESRSRRAYKAGKAPVGKGTP